MSPEEVRELLPLYALGALSPEERSRVEEALSRYPELWAEAKALMEAASQLSGAVPPAPVPPGIEAKVMARIRALRRPSPWGWLGRAAAVLLLLALGYGAFLGGSWLLALREPTTQVLTLVSPQGEVVGRVILRADRRALILLNHLPPKGKVFQAWGLDRGEPLPLSTFRLPVKTLRLPPEAFAVAVSLEPPGGSPKPTTLLGLPR
ncbi:MAG: anti-sigma factor domain-containing protein [Thermus caldifontis]